ncbi:hypothetical protein SUDANB140_06140 [Streptomyces sp. enrichment culture]
MGILDAVAPAPRGVDGVVAVLDGVASRGPYRIATS